MDFGQFAILILVGVLFWMAGNYIPMARRTRQVLNIVAVIAFVLWLGNLFGIFSSVPGIHLGN